MLTSEEITRRLTDSLRSLHMPTIRASYADTAEQARGNGYSYERYLLELAEQECEDRRLRVSAL